eukprot:CAMPEP_0175074752 /NCGR_PEP_ID=MMETSP0052_2-20121109/21514_1 /TAXON_ID=51329 ORGANISM="Polytomella parva, Strain SAG 63-3" /NCGR_SAMPLE_ID=MMETSP0052_2 /ASSEMBLY_ACC=CAM_ASM_000194 /LENGTH=419 /DNA_ID=CAMNT_0016343151 /DNA_START=1159 /DNA_END=2416 /DNA_ORIENTATION=+
MRPSMWIHSDSDLNLYLIQIQIRIAIRFLIQSIRFFTQPIPSLPCTRPGVIRGFAGYAIIANRSNSSSSRGGGGSGGGNGGGGGGERVEEIAYRVLRASDRSSQGRGEACGGGGGGGGGGGSTKDIEGIFVGVTVKILNAVIGAAAAATASVGVAGPTMPSSMSTSIAYAAPSSSMSTSPATYSKSESITPPPASGSGTSLPPPLVRPIDPALVIGLLTAVKNLIHVSGQQSDLSYIDCTAVQGVLAGPLGNAAMATTSGAIRSLCLSIMTSMLSFSLRRETAERFRDVCIAIVSNDSSPKTVVAVTDVIAALPTLLGPLVTSRQLLPFLIPTLVTPNLRLTDVQRLSKHAQSMLSSVTRFAMEAASEQLVEAGQGESGEGGEGGRESRWYGSSPRDGSTNASGISHASGSKDSLWMTA